MESSSPCFTPLGAPRILTVERVAYWQLETPGRLIDGLKCLVLCFGSHDGVRGLPGLGRRGRCEVEGH